MFSMPLEELTDNVGDRGTPESSAPSHSQHLHKSQLQTYSSLPHNILLERKILREFHKGVVPVLH